MRRWISSRAWIMAAGRCLLGAIFIVAAFVKISWPQDFADSIAAYQILPPAAINVIALGLPLFELLCGLLVLGGFHVRIGSLGILTMLVVFSGALALAWARRLSIDCGCFGPYPWLHARPAVALLRDLLLLGLAVLIYRFGKAGTSAGKPAVSAER